MLCSFSQPIYSHRRTHKEELQQRNRFGTVSRKSTLFAGGGGRGGGGIYGEVVCVWFGGGGGRGGNSPVFLARNLTLNSDAAPKNEYSVRVIPITVINIVLLIFSLYKHPTHQLTREIYKLKLTALASEM